MIYFVKTDDMIEKYQITFDKQKINELNKKIIDNCSHIEHREYESDYLPMIDEANLIRNITYTNTGKKKEYFEEIRDIYLLKYDEYKPPRLVKLIDRLLNDETKAIDEIFKYKLNKEMTIDDKISLANDEFNKIPSDNIDLKKEKLKELEKLINTKKATINQQGIELYYNQLIDLIDINMVDLISINELKRIENFLETKFSSKSDIDKLNQNIKLKLEKSKKEKMKSFETDLTSNSDSIKFKVLINN